MQAYLINPTERTVTSVSYSGELDHAYRLLNCELVTVVYIGHGQDSIFVDDEGLLSDLDKKDFFIYERPDGSEQFLCGNGLVTGCDAEGYTVAATISIDELSKRVNWCEREAGAKYGEYLLSQSPMVFTME